MSWELFVKYKIHTHTSDAEATTIIITTIIIIISDKAMGMKRRTTGYDDVYRLSGQVLCAIYNIFAAIVPLFVIVVVAKVAAKYENIIYWCCCVPRTATSTSYICSTNLPPFLSPPSFQVEVATVLVPQVIFHRHHTIHQLYWLVPQSRHDAHNRGGSSAWCHCLAVYHGLLLPGSLVHSFVRSSVRPFARTPQTTGTLMRV